MASFLYYFYEVNVMSWLKKYLWYIAVSISCSLFGVIIWITIANKNIGSLADWVSGIGSLLAVAFAYWQIAEQRKQYKKDKTYEIKREILANRPFFSFMKLFYLRKVKDHLWLTEDDTNFKKINDIFRHNSKFMNEISEYEFKNDICAYEFKNVSKAIATKVALKIEYQNKVNNKVMKTDHCCIRSCVIENERVIILPHSIMNEPKPYSSFPKNVYLYFTTIDDRTYCQKWIEKIDKSNRMFIEQADIKEVPKEEMPDEGASSCMEV